MQLAWRDDDERLVAKVTGGWAKDRVLEIRTCSLKDGHRAVRVIPWPITGQAAQSKTSEVNGADRILGTACRELPHPAITPQTSTYRLPSTSTISTSCAVAS